MTHPTEDVGTDELLPCPFCGKPPRHSTVPSSQFVCNNRRCALYHSVVFATVEQWNERQSGLTLPEWQEKAAQRTLGMQARGDQ